MRKPTTDGFLIAALSVEFSHCLKKKKKIYISFKEDAEIYTGCWKIGFFFWLFVVRDE